MGKGPTYGEFTFPKSEVTYVRGYARGGKVSQAKVSKVMHEFGAGELHSGSKKGPVVQNRKQAIAIGMSEGRKAAAGKYSGGGMVGKPAAVMKPRGKKPPSGKSLKNPVPKDAGAPKAPAAMGAMGSMGMKAGGLAKKASLSMSPKAKSDAPPKSINVKSRMGIGLGGSVEKLSHGGRVKKKYAAGGAVHPDAAEDKALIKRAVGMHDTQLHGGKHTNLTKLGGGGLAKMSKGYKAGGVVHKKYGGFCK